MDDPYKVPRYTYKGEVFDATITNRGPALRTPHLGLAETLIEIIQEGCRWFTEANPPPMMGVADVPPVSMERIDDRLRRYDWGENLREARRTFSDTEARYHLLELPPDRKRAIVEQIDYLLKTAGFAWLDNPARLRIRACALCRGTIHTMRIADGRHWWAARCRHHEAPILVWRYHWLPSGRTLALLERKYKEMFPEVGELRDYPLTRNGHVIFHPKEAERILPKGDYNAPDYLGAYYSHVGYGI